MKKIDYFDTKETEIIFDVCLTRQIIQDIKKEVEAKQQAGTFNDAEFKKFKAQMRAFKLKAMELTEIPLVDFYRRYDYFRFTKNLHNFDLQ